MATTIGELAAQRFFMAQQQRAALMQQQQQQQQQRESDSFNQLIAIQKHASDLQTARQARDLDFARAMGEMSQLAGGPAPKYEAGSPEEGYATLGGLTGAAQQSQMPRQIATAAATAAVKQPFIQENIVKRGEQARETATLKNLMGDVDRKDTQGFQKVMQDSRQAATNARAEYSAFNPVRRSATDAINDSQLTFQSIGRIREVYKNSLSNPIVQKYIKANIAVDRWVPDEDGGLTSEDIANFTSLQGELNNMVINYVKQMAATTFTDRFVETAKTITPGTQHSPKEFIALLNRFERSIVDANKHLAQVVKNPTYKVPGGVPGVGGAPMAGSQSFDMAAAIKALGEAARKK